MSNVPKAVKLSGVVYVKDPRDLQQIQLLRDEVRELRGRLKQVPSTKDLEKREIRLDRKEELLEEENSYICERFRTLDKLRNLSVKHFLSTDVDSSYRDSSIAQRIKKKMEGHTK